MRLNGETAMRKRVGYRKSGWADITMMAAGTIFQISSCTLDENGVFNAFADTLALSDLRNQLFENSPFSDIVENFDGFGGPSDAE